MAEIGPTNHRIEKEKINPLVDGVVDFEVKVMTNYSLNIHAYFAKIV